MTFNTMGWESVGGGQKVWGEAWERKTEAGANVRLGRLGKHNQHYVPNETHLFRPKERYNTSVW